MKTEPANPPSRVVPGDPIRELRALVERSIENAARHIERHEQERGPAWLERELIGAQ